jgi:hypothetical protein
LQLVFGNANFGSVLADKGLLVLLVELEEFLLAVVGHFFDFLGRHWSVPLVGQNEFARILVVSLNSLEIAVCGVKELLVFRVVVLLDPAEVVKLVRSKVTGPVGNLDLPGMEGQRN